MIVFARPCSALRRRQAPGVVDGAAYSEDLFLYRGVQVSFSQISRARVSSGLSAYRAKCRSTSRCCADRRSQAFEPVSYCDPPDTGNYPKPSSTRRAVSESPSSHRFRAVLFDVGVEFGGLRAEFFCFGEFCLSGLGLLVGGTQPILHETAVTEAR